MMHGMTVCMIACLNNPSSRSNSPRTSRRGFCIQEDTHFGNMSQKKNENMCFLIHTQSMKVLVALGKSASNCLMRVTRSLSFFAFLSIDLSSKLSSYHCLRRDCLFASSNASLSRGSKIAESHSTTLTGMYRFASSIGTVKKF